MNEMVERVARALTLGVCKACRRPCVGRGGGATPDCDRNDCEWRPANNHERARAAIEAMREPTDEMIDYGWEQLNWGPRAGYDDKHACPKVAWQTMIDAALHSEKVTT